MRRLRLRLSLKLAFLVVLVVIVAAGVGCLAAIVAGRAVLKAEAMTDVDTRLDTYSRAIEFYLDHARSVLETTANFPLITRFTIDRDLVGSIVNKAGVFEYMMLLRADGGVHILEPESLERRLSHRNLAFHAWFRAVVERRAVVVSDLHISPATQRPTVVLAAPVVSRDGQLVGVWAGALRLEAFARLARSAPGTRGGYGYITDRRGLIIAHQRRATYVENQTDFSAFPTVRRALAGEHGTLEFVSPISGISAFGAYRRLDPYGWAVAYAIPTDVAMAPLGPMARGTVLAAVLLAVVMGGVGLLLARRIVDPLRRLTASATTLGAGDFSGERLNIRTGDEIEDLAGALDRMATSLQEVISAERRARVQVEEQSRRLQEASRLKSEFLANMSHELRTPLNAIIGFTELIHDGRVGPVAETQREYLADTLTSARHLLQLINDVLDLAKVESGAMQFHPEPTDLAQVAAEVRDVLRQEAAGKRIQLEVVTEPGLGPVVLDPAKVRQVLYNYVSNAVKFTEPEGRVTIRLSGEGADFVRIEVEDTGIGIAPEHLGRLFVEFQQLDGGFAKRQPGTGLGLALTRRIVEAQGGRVGVHSVAGQGSTFSAVLPRAAASAPPGSPAVPSPETRRSGAPCVLVVEDDPPERAWLEQVLADAGYAVEVATSGRQAVDRAAERAFDAIALDPTLPDLSPASVLSTIRASGPNHGTPIVLTAAAERDATALAVHDVLAKPIGAEALLQSLARAGVVPGSARPILVVDDDLATLRLAEVTLKQRGYRVLGTRGGAAALRAVQTAVPAAVVLDLVMPEMDGFEFLDRYRASSPAGVHIPVIVWTAKDLTVAEQARLGHGVVRVVSKREGGARSLLDALDAVVRPA